MKLNLTKCTFKVSSGKFLGFLVTQRGIEVSQDRSEHSETYHSPNV